MRRLRRYRYWAFSHVVLWLTMQFAMAGGLAAMGPAQTETALGPTEYVMICTPEGFKWIAASELFGPTGESAADANTAPIVVDPHCDWCQAFALVVLPERVSVCSCAGLVAEPVLYAISQVWTSSSDTAGKGFDSRAPPL